MLTRTFLKFSFVGVIGFIVDAGVLLAALGVGAGLYSGRLISFLCAVTTTWFLNRIFTFGSRDRELLKEWTRFASANSVGGAINYATYALLVWQIPFIAEYPVNGVAAGSLAGLIWNFAVSRKFVYKN